MTIVAAWIRALTGVGPSIASGNHTYSGTWADFPVAPMKSSNVIAVISSPPSSTTRSGWSSTVAKSKLPNVVKMRKRPTMNAKSPTRLVINAFLPAEAAAGRSNQYPIKRKEQTPTSSHPTNMTRKLSAMTSSSIEKVKRLR